MREQEKRWDKRQKSFLGSLYPLSSPPSLNTLEDKRLGFLPPDLLLRCVLRRRRGERTQGTKERLLRCDLKASNILTCRAMIPNNPKQAYCTKFLLRIRTQPPGREAENQTEVSVRDTSQATTTYKPQCCPLLLDSRIKSEKHKNRHYASWYVLGLFYFPTRTNVINSNSILWCRS